MFFFLGGQLPSMGSSMLVLALMGGTSRLNSRRSGSAGSRSVSRVCSVSSGLDPGLKA